MKEAIFRENLAEYDGRWNYNMNTDFRPRTHINAGIKMLPDQLCELLQYG